MNEVLFVVGIGIMVGVGLLALYIIVSGLIELNKGFRRTKK